MSLPTTNAHPDFDVYGMIRSSLQEEICRLREAIRAATRLMPKDSIMREELLNLLPETKDED